jgi:hypothetical protein
VYADIDHLGLADVWWVDLDSGETGGKSLVAERGTMVLPERPGAAPLRVDRDGLALDLVDTDDATQLRAEWTEPDGRPSRFAIDVHLPPGHESVNVVIPWSDDEFNFTSKHQARPALGELVVGDRQWQIGGAAGDAWGVLDVGRGRWPHAIHWNWGGGGGRSADGNHVIGLQFGAKWTAGTGYTENGLIVDGRLSKLGTELDWTYDWDDPMKPWTIDDPGGQLHAVLTPRFDKHTKLGAGADAGADEAGFGSETHQVFGTWSGRLTTDDGLTLAFDGLQGFAEEARQLW